MNLKLVVFAIFVSTYEAESAILLWSKQKFEISPLKQFTDTELQDLIGELGYPEVSIYKSISFHPKLESLLHGYYRAYSANDDINSQNATELNSAEDLEVLKAKQQLESPLDNILSILLIHDNERFKREAVTTTQSSQDEPQGPLNGPVLYRGKSKKDDNYGILYSTQPLMLKSANSSVLFLGNTSDDLITVDTQARDSFTRLNINIPVEEGNKVTLRFLFTWSNWRYWTLHSVKISDTNNLYNFNLTLPEKITAPGNFSYHCTGSTIFTDGSTELNITDMQVQIDSGDGNFRDAYDCVSFTTAPIWAGIFVTLILAIGLVIALTAIMEIKTMDKFDNYKTRQLAITVVE